MYISLLFWISLVYLQTSVLHSEQHMSYELKTNPQKTIFRLTDLVFWSRVLDLLTADIIDFTLPFRVHVVPFLCTDFDNFRTSVLLVNDFDFGCGGMD